MTWSKIAQSPVYVTAWTNTVPEYLGLRLQVGTASVDLSPEDAASLGEYLQTKARELIDE